MIPGHDGRKGVPEGVEELVGGEYGLDGEWVGMFVGYAGLLDEVDEVWEYLGLGDWGENPGEEGG